MRHQAILKNLSARVEMSQKPYSKQIFWPTLKGAHTSKNQPMLWLSQWSGQAGSHPKTTKSRACRREEVLGRFLL